MQGSFNLFYPIRRTSYFAYGSASWYGAEISESENPVGDRIFRNSGSKNNFEIENFGRKKSEIRNRVDLNHINAEFYHANSNHTNSNCADLNHDESNHTYLIPPDLPNNYSANFWSLQLILSWDRYLMDAAARIFSKITLVNNYV